MFFIPYDDWKMLFLMKVYRYSEGSFYSTAIAFFEASVLKEVRNLCSKIQLLHIIIAIYLCIHEKWSPWDYVTKLCGNRLIKVLPWVWKITNLAILI